MPHAIRRNRFCSSGPLGQSPQVVAELGEVFDPTIKRRVMVPWQLRQGTADWYGDNRRTGVGSPIWSARVALNVHAATVEKFHDKPASPGVSLKVTPGAQYASNRADIQIVTSRLLGILSGDQCERLSEPRKIEHIQPRRCISAHLQEDAAIPHGRLFGNVLIHLRSPILFRLSVAGDLTALALDGSRSPMHRSTPAWRGPSPPRQSRTLGSKAHLREYRHRLGTQHRQQHTASQP